MDGSLQTVDFLFRYEIQNGRYGRTKFNFGPFGKNVSKRFFSEIIWTIESKLHRNDHWKVLYTVSVLYADRKSKMAATEEHRLTLDPMGKFQMPFSQKLHI